MVAYYPTGAESAKAQRDHLMNESAQRDLETTSEAVYADCVSEDGRQGLVVRLCRYPEAGFAWLWCHLFLDGRTWAYTEHTLDCDGALTDLTADPTRYVLQWPSGAVRFERSGPREMPRRCLITARCSAHRSRHAPHGAGPEAVKVDVAFHPASRAVSNLAGRTEVLGTVEGSVVASGATTPIRGRGQFHEQVQTAPRFTTPFTYLTLRGADIGFIAIRLRDRGRGFLLRPDAVTEIVRIGLTPPGSERRLELEDQGGTMTVGELVTTHDYSVPVFDGIRPGTLVTGTLGGRPVSGCVNDYLTDDLGFERTTARGLVPQTATGTFPPALR